MMMHECNRLVCSHEEIRQQVNLSSYFCAQRAFTKTNIYNLILPFVHSSGHVTYLQTSTGAARHFSCPNVSIVARPLTGTCHSVSLVPQFLSSMAKLWQNLLIIITDRCRWYI